MSVFQGAANTLVLPMITQLQRLQDHQRLGIVRDQFLRALPGSLGDLESFDMVASGKVEASVSFKMGQSMTVLAGDVTVSLYR